MIFYAISISREACQRCLLVIISGGKIAQVTVSIEVGRKSLLVSSCMTDPPRTASLGAVEVQPGAAFLPRRAQVQESARISRNCMRVFGLLP